MNAPGVRVLVPTRTATGVESVVAVAPTAVNAAGTRAQFIVPDLAQTGAITVTTIGSQNLGFSGNADAIHRGLTLTFTATGATTEIFFTDEGLEGIGNESWGLDNVALALAGAPGTVLFSDDFEGGAQANWQDPTTDNTVPANFTEFSGRFSSGSQRLAVSGLTAGMDYTLTFDLYMLDDWDGIAGPDFFDVIIDGTEVFHEAFANGAGTQTFARAESGSELLQVVPVIAGLTGRPGLDSTFDLLGSGFMEGASTVTIGGTVITDVFTNDTSFGSGLLDGDVSGTRNGTYRLVAPLAVEGPIMVTTAGGSFQFAGPVFAEPAFVEFTGVEGGTTVASGAPTDAGQAFANTGQFIVLTGRGFVSNSTVVQFTARDAQGVEGVLHRTGTASNGGTLLTVQVPALAQTGEVRVIGSDTVIPLQIVPTLRSLGGSIVTGNQIVLEGTGLIEGDLNVLIDGEAAFALDVQTTADSNTTSAGFLDQQIVTLTVPTGVSAGVVTVTTSGGSFTLRPAIPVTVATPIMVNTDVGDTLATAHAVAVGSNSQVTIDGTGLATNAAQDVDLFSFTANAGDVVAIDVTRITGFFALRVFTAAGQQLAVNQYSGPSSGPRVDLLTLPATGTYYLGISDDTNLTYDPTVAGSGTGGSGTGTYTLTIKREDAVGRSLSGSGAVATSGTPADAGLVSANTGQTITLLGAGLVTGDRVVFTTSDTSGRLGTSIVTPTSIAGDGSSLEVVVPTTAASGMVRLERELAGLFLQVVPTLTDVEQGVGGVFHGGSLTLRGSGFTEGILAVNFGGTTLTDQSVFTGPDQFSNNTQMFFTVPNDVSTGPITVTTLGGTSAVFGLTFTGITDDQGGVAMATSGVAADNAVASANPGDTITLQGTGFDATTDVVFLVSNASGVVSERVVRPTAVNGDGTEIVVLVPLDAVTGPVSLVGDQLNAQRLLQIVPTVSNVDLTSVSSTTANFTLTGSGFIEGHGTVYALGAIDILDKSVTTGPNAFSSNTTTQLSSAFGPDLFGAVTVTTAGGTSAAYSVGFTDLVGTALSGIATDSGEASANAGQVVTIEGSGLSLTTDVVAQYVDDSGNVQTVLLNPTFAEADGTAAQVPVPTFLTGAFDVHVVGAANGELLQIVPVVTSADINNSTPNLRLDGSGFVEGNDTVYTLGNGSVTDTSTNTTINVFSSGSAVNVTTPVHGLGNVTVQTTGGTSAPVAVNWLHPGLGQLHDVAFDATANELIVSNGTDYHRLDPVTGAVLGSVALPDAFTNSVGLQILPGAIGSLGGTAVAAGSLLITDGDASFDKIFAVTPSDGTVLATLDLGQNINPVGGVYHAGRG
ncbi:MAG: beta strand repeat-containing protein, partial [Planctomycetota bacterium]